MKKLFLVIVCVLGLTSFANAQEKGDIQINAGIEFLSHNTPVYAGLDYFLIDNVSIGGVFTFIKNSSTFGANGNYHFNQLLTLPEEWDVYAGVNLNISPETYLGGQVGGRYFFTPNWAANLEFSGNKLYSGILIGASFRL